MCGVVAFISLFRVHSSQLIVKSSEFGFIVDSSQFRVQISGQSSAVQPSPVHPVQTSPVQFRIRS